MAQNSEGLFDSLQRFNLNHSNDPAPGTTKRKNTGTMQKKSLRLNTASK